MKYLTSKFKSGVVIGSGLVILSGCAGMNARDTAIIGGILGTATGLAIGRDLGGAAIGAAVGATGGYMIGNEMDKEQATRERARLEQMGNVVVEINNPNGSRNLVPLTRLSGGGYQGPKGEIYRSIPTEEQLKPYYGLN